MYLPHSGFYSYSEIWEYLRHNQKHAYKANGLQWSIVGNSSYVADIDAKSNQKNRPMVRIFGDLGSMMVGKVQSLWTSLSFGNIELLMASVYRPCFPTAIGPTLTFPTQSMMFNWAIINYSRRAYRINQKSCPCNQFCP